MPTLSEAGSTLAWSCVVDVGKAHEDLEASLRSFVRNRRACWPLSQVDPLIFTPRLIILEPVRIHPHDGDDRKEAWQPAVKVEWDVDVVAVIFDDTAPDLLVVHGVSDSLAFLSFETSESEDQVIELERCAALMSTLDSMSRNLATNTKLPKQNVHSVAKSMKIVVAEHVAFSK